MQSWCFHHQSFNGKNSVFYLGGPAHSRLPVCLRPLNDETFKAAVVEVTKAASDTNLQRYYVSDS